jgi:ABC-type antimicrobial peptide transport system permease subunit
MPVSRFLSIDVNFFPDSILSYMRLSITDIQFISADGTTQASGFIQANWDIVRGFNAAAPAEFAINPDIPESYGEEAMVMEWIGGDFDSNGSAFSLLLEYPEAGSMTVAGGDESNAISEGEIVGIPALVSRSFAELNEFTEGQRFSLFVNNVAPWFELSRQIEYYPTLYQERPYIVTDIDLLNRTLSRGGNGFVRPNELWIRLNDGVDEEAFIASLQSSEDAPLFKAIFGLEAILSGYETDVLSLGVIGLLYISFTVGLALSIVSLLTYISLTVQARMGEFAVLRAMGLTTSRMVWSIMIEQILVLFAAIILGAVIGQFLTSQVLPPLALSAAGGIVTPPFVLRLDFGTIAQYLLILIAVLLFVLLLSALWVRRTATAEALRLTED